LSQLRWISDLIDEIPGSVEDFATIATSQ